MREIRIRKEESGQRLDKFLRRFLPGAGTGFIYKMLRKKNILLDGRKAEGREILQEGSLIRIYFSDETLQAFQTPSGSDHLPKICSQNNPYYCTIFYAICKEL